MRMRPNTERRVTPWKPIWWDDPSTEAVRIWQEFDGVRWWQMHEWRKRDGSSDAEGWIPSGRSWAKTAVETTEAAPGDPPILTADELDYLIDRLDGVNDPVGRSALSKLRAIRLATSEGG